MCSSMVSPPERSPVRQGEARLAGRGVSVGSRWGQLDPSAKLQLLALHRNPSSPLQSGLHSLPRPRGVGSSVFRGVQFLLYSGHIALAKAGCGTRSGTERGLPPPAPLRGRKEGPTGHTTGDWAGTESRRGRRTRGERSGAAWSPLQTD